MIFFVLFPLSVYVAKTKNQVVLSGLIPLAMIWGSAGGITSIIIIVLLAELGVEAGHRRGARLAETEIPHGTQ